MALLDVDRCLRKWESAAFVLRLPGDFGLEGPSASDESGPADLLVFSPSARLDVLVPRGAAPKIAPLLGSLHSRASGQHERVWIAERSGAVAKLHWVRSASGSNV